MKQCGVTFRKMGAGAKIGSKLMRTDLRCRLFRGAVTVEKVGRLSFFCGGEKAEKGRRDAERIRRTQTLEECSCYLCASISQVSIFFVKRVNPQLTIIINVC